MLYRAAELRVPGVIELELIPTQTTEPPEHLSEHTSVEAPILLGRELAESTEPVARLERHEVREIASLSAAEHRQHLVDGELLAGQRRPEPARLGREEPRVRRQVELGALVAVRDDQANEAGAHLHVPDDEPCRAQGATDGRRQPVDGVTAEAEEVEVAGLPSNVPPRDQRGAAGERKPVRFVESRDDLRDLLLERSEHLRVA